MSLEHNYEYFASQGRLFPLLSPVYLRLRKRESTDSPKRTDSSLAFARVRGVSRYGQLTLILLSTKETRKTRYSIESATGTLQGALSEKVTEGHEKYKDGKENEGEKKSGHGIFLSVGQCCPGKGRGPVSVAMIKKALSPRLLAVAVALFCPMAMRAVAQASARVQLSWMTETLKRRSGVAFPV